MHKLIAGVRVNLDNTEVKECKSSYDISKLGLFEHLSDEQKDLAEVELLETLETFDNSEQTDD